MRTCFPIGVDVDELQETAARAINSRQVRRTADSLKNKHLIIGVDRLDYSKGLMQRMLAYETAA